MKLIGIYTLNYSMDVTGIKYLYTLIIDELYLRNKYVSYDAFPNDTMK